MVTIGLEFGPQENKFDQTCSLLMRNVNAAYNASSPPATVNLVYASPSSVLPHEFEDSIIVKLCGKTKQITLAIRVPETCVEWSSDQCVDFIRLTGISAIERGLKRMNDALKSNHDSTAFSQWFTDWAVLPNT